MTKFPAIERPSERLAVLAAVLKSVVSYDGGHVDPVAVLADVMTDLDLPEEAVASDVNMAIFVLTGGALIGTNTIGLISQRTKIWAPPRLAEWINDRHVPYDDGEAA